MIANNYFVQSYRFTAISQYDTLLFLTCFDRYAIHAVLSIAIIQPNFAKSTLQATCIRKTPDNYNSQSAVVNNIIITTFA